MKGHPVRGFFAGLLLGIVLDLDLFLGGVVESDSTVLVVLPIVCIVGAFVLGLWAPIGRRRKRKDPSHPVPLPAPVAWPETAPVEGSTPTPGSWKAPRPASEAPPPAPPPAQSI